jgi:alpha-tubulin suppressor-like RCC1 family protein
MLVAAAGGLCSGGTVADAEVNNLPTGGKAVTRVVAASYSFSALTDDGDIYAWGLAAQLPGKPNELIGKGFTDLYAAERAFLSISKTAMAPNYAYAWGYPLSGGYLPTDKMLFPEGDYLLANTANAFLLQAKGEGSGDSKVYLWGNVAFGNTSENVIIDVLQWLDIASVTTTNRAFAVLSEQGHVYAWGEPAEGGNIPDYYDPQTGAAVVEETVGAVEFKSEFYDIVAIYASSSLDSITDAVSTNVAEFTAIRQDGAVLYWGGG